MFEEKQDLKELSLAQLVSRVCRLSGERLRVIIEGIGLHKGQAFILFQLLKRPGMAQNEIAHGLNVSPATVTNSLKRLERDGWITRQREPKDQRIMHVYLTAKAKALHESIRGSFDALDTELKAVLTDKEEQELSRLLIKIHTRLALPHKSKEKRFLDTKDGS
jgi:MarR family transcriptional regulator, organic hydroperoxide resistance regulator